MVEKQEDVAVYVRDGDVAEVVTLSGVEVGSVVRRIMYVPVKADGTELRAENSQTDAVQALVRARSGKGERDE